MFSKLGIIVLPGYENWSAVAEIVDAADAGQLMYTNHVGAAGFPGVMLITEQRARLKNQMKASILSVIEKADEIFIFCNEASGLYKRCAREVIGSGKPVCVIGPEGEPLAEIRKEDYLPREAG